MVYMCGWITNQTIGITPFFDFTFIITQKNTFVNNYF